MAKFGAIGEAFEVMQEEVEQGGSTAKQQITGKTAAANQTQAQGSKQNQQTSQSQANTAQQVPSDVNQSQIADQIQQMPSESADPQTKSDDHTKKFIQDLYGGSSSEITQAEIAQKEAEDKAKAEALRKKLHEETYFQPLITSHKQHEERPAEKIGREEKEKKEKLMAQEEKNKKDELPVIVTKDMGTKEKLRGVSG